MTTTYPPRRLTEGFIRGLPNASAPYFVRDTRVVGLLVTVNKLSKSYKVQKDLWVGQRGRRRLAKTVRHTLGTIDDLCLDDARTKAEEVIAKIKKGIDPNALLGGYGDGAHVWTVERMFKEYTSDMRTRDRADRTMVDILDRLDRYLRGWKPLPITEIKRSMAREEHKRISREHGPRVANQAMKDFRAAYNLALRVVDDPDALPPNPISAVTMNPERSGSRIMLPEEMPEWWGKVQTLPNPLRRIMHTFGLLSGLRPGCLVSLRREWVHLDKKAISIPRMKSGRSFDLPLSEYMVNLIKDAFKYGDVLYPNTEWVFHRDRAPSTDA